MDGRERFIVREREEGKGDDYTANTRHIRRDPGVETEGEEG